MFWNYDEATPQWKFSKLLRFTKLVNYLNCLISKDGINFDPVKLDKIKQLLKHES